MDGISGGKRKTMGHASSLDHSRVQKSTTLSRRFVQKPVSNLSIAGVAGAASQSLRKQLEEQERQKKIKSVVAVRVQRSQNAQQASLIQKKNTVKLSPSRKKVVVKEQSTDLAKQEQKKMQ